MAVVIARNFRTDRQKSLDRIEVWTVARNEVELDPASLSCQPFLNQDSMVIPGIIEKDVNKSFRGIHEHDRHQERDCARGIDGCRFDHAGGARFQINGSMKVQALPPAGPSSARQS
jgi:hypothetical protein